MADIKKTTKTRKKNFFKEKKQIQTENWGFSR